MTTSVTLRAAPKIQQSIDIAALVQAMPIVLLLSELFIIMQLLWQLYGFCRAKIYASAAINTFVGVNYIFVVPCGNSVGGAFRFASAAADTIIINKICHNLSQPPLISQPIVS